MSPPPCSIDGVRHHSLNMNASKGSEGGKRKFHQPNETPKTPKGNQLRVERRVVCTCRKKRSVKEKRKVTTTTSSN